MIEGAARPAAAHPRQGVRVLMFCPQFAPAIGGAERQAEKLGSAMVNLGVDVRILTPRLDQASPALESREGVAVRRFRLSDLSRRFPGIRGIGVLNAPWIALQIGWQVWRAARRVDVVHCHIGSLQTVAAAYAARLRGKPVICKAAIADERSDLGEAARTGVTGRIVARLGTRAFTRWVATTRAVREALCRAGVEDRIIEVIPNGVEVATTVERQGPPAIRRFLYLGRLSTNIERDVPGLIQAFDRLAGEVEGVELAIVGGGDLLEPTRALAAGCRHALSIQVPGPGVASEWLAWADCFVLPSRREGLSNALLEAMAAGLPCIANDIPPNREVLAEGEAGVLVPVGDIEQLHAALLSFALGSQPAQTISSAALGRVSAHYSIESVARSYCALYSVLLNPTDRAEG